MQFNGLIFDPESVLQPVKPKLIFQNENFLLHIFVVHSKTFQSIIIKLFFIK